VNWVLDADIRGFYDNISHEWAVKFIEHRVGDPRMVRLIQKWLKAGVSEEGQWSETRVGTPQGAVASPLLANIYLHYVFDLWVEVWRQKVAQGDVLVVRYADDLVVGFESRMEAERFLKEFRERLAKFGLELHPEKTRLIQFGRFAAQNRKQRGMGKPETFTFLGFTHYSGKMEHSLCGA
jgi:retron-type reverse transcriptase